MNRMTFAISALLAVLTMAVGLSGCGGVASATSAADAVKGYYTALGAGKVERALGYIAPGERQGDKAADLRGLLGMTGQQYKQRGGVKSVEIVKEEPQGKGVLVSAKVTTGDGNSTPETNVAIEVDGKWYISLSH